MLSLKNLHDTHHSDITGTDLPSTPECLCLAFRSWEPYLHATSGVEKA